MCRSLTELANYGEAVRMTAQRLPDKTAIICGVDRCTFAQLEENSNRVASALAASGIEPGDMVGILSPNRIDYFEVLAGCAKMGAVAVLLNWRFAPSELLQLIRFNDVGLVFHRYRQNSAWERELLSGLASQDQPVRMISLEADSSEPDSYQRFLRSGSPDFPITFHDPEATVMHLHTAGTTGFPKCVAYSHRGWMGQLDATARGLGFDEDMVFQSMTQLFHSGSSGIQASLAIGATVVLFSSFEPQAYLAAAQRERVTRVSTVPTVLQSLLRQPNLKDFDLTSVKIIGYGSSSLLPSLIERAMKAFPNCGFSQSYGMTEMGSTVTALLPEDHLRGNYKYLSTVGKAIPGAAVRILDDNGKECPPGTVGEIVLQGAGMMKHYYKMPEKTAEVLVNGWYHSRDLGYLDEDGYLTLCGRKDEMIITGAENVFPSEIENVICQREDVASACVFGVQDDYWGQRIVACVVPKTGCTLDGEEIKAYCRSRIAGYKVPKQVEILNELPCNAVGKIDRSVLIRRYS